MNFIPKLGHSHLCKCARCLKWNPGWKCVITSEKEAK